MNEMNETTDLETQLLGWTPRRPSARLERRLFGGSRAPAEVLLPFRLTWLAPATVALAMLCVLVNQRYGAAFATAASPAPMVAMILSNQSAAAYLPGSVQAEQNNLPADAFKWTRGSSAPLSPAFISRSKGSNQR
jgi:hypothetical protein